MGSDLSYFSPQGEGGTRPALAQLPIRAEDLGLPGSHTMRLSRRHRTFLLAFALLCTLLGLGK